MTQQQIKTAAMSKTSKKQAVLMSSFDMTTLAANLADSKKAGDIRVLDTSKVSNLADYFVICTGESAPQIRTIADEIQRQFRQRGIETITGNLMDDKNSKWMLLDFGDVVIHVMSPEEREYYQLEQFWNHAEEVGEDKWRYKTRQAS